MRNISIYSICRNISHPTDQDQPKTGVFKKMRNVLIFLLPLLMFSQNPAHTETFTRLDSEELRSAVVPIVEHLKVPFAHSLNIEKQIRVEEERTGWPGCVMRKRVK